MIQEWGIKTRVLFLTLVPTITISLLLSAYFTSTRIQDLEQALQNRGYAIALQMAPASEYGVFSGNTHTLQRLANDSLSEPEVRSVSIFNKDGRLLAHAGHEHQSPTNIISVTDQSHGITMADTGNSLLFTVPVTIHDVILDDYAYSDSPYDHSENHDNVLGWISIELGRMTTTIRQYQVLFACSVIVLIGLGISGIFAFRMGRDVTLPILQMASAVEKIKNGNLDTRVYTNARGELRRLEAGINTMAASLKTAHEEMQQSVEQATADLRQTLETIEIQNIELEMARKEAETASRVKSEFLANMSHEIRTPLNGVMGFINLLMKTPLDNRQGDYLNTIQKCANNLLSIINDILDFSKIEAGKLKLNKNPMDLRECVEEALTLMAPNAHEKSLELVPMIYSDVPENIMGDHLRLKQVITNLVNNAIKFTDQGSVVVRVMLEKTSKDNVVICISITDTGIGLSQDEQAPLFQAFSQADSTTTRRFGGTGLGLVISKRLVQQMDGEIGVESELGKGSTFWFTFTAELAPEPEETLKPIDLSNLNILVYDPHPVTQLSLRHILSHTNCKIHTGNTDTEIHDIIDKQAKDQNPIDLLIVGSNDYKEEQEFIAELIKLGKTKYSYKTATLLNNTDQSIYDQLINLGSIFSQSKPIRQHKLFDALAEHFNKSDPSAPQLPAKQKIATEVAKKQLSIKVLAVDDHPANLKLVAAMLENMGIQVDCADNGEKALELFAANRYDIIFMDIQMPEMDGIEVTNRIRITEKPGLHTPIVALTAHALAQEKEALLCAGMDDYLTKPIDEAALKRMIASWTKKLVYKEISAKPSISEQTNKNDESCISLDWQKTLKLAGNNKSLALDMLVGLVENLPESQQIINQTYMERDFKAMREEVHRLHGACCYCGVPCLKQAVQALETAIVKNQQKTIDFLMVELNKEIKKLQTSFDEFQQNPSSESVY